MYALFTVKKIFMKNIGFFIPNNFGKFQYAFIPLSSKIIEEKFELIATSDILCLIS